MSQILGCEFNPKNLPNEKIGICRNPYHYDVVGERPHRNTKLRLVMMYSNEYVEKWCDCSKKFDLSDDDFDKKYDEMQKIQFRLNSEAYYCEPCCDDLVENSC